MVKSKKIILLILISFILVSITSTYLLNNGSFRTTLRAIFDIKYPVEIKQISGNIVEFDLSYKKPALLALGVRYPKEVNLKEIHGGDINGNINIKLYKDRVLIKEDSTIKIDKTWLDYRNTGYKVSVFYTFEWSPPINILKASNESKIIINLKNKFQDYDLILSDAGIK